MSNYSSILRFQMPSTKAIVSTAASAAATAMILRSVIREHLPKEIRHYLYEKLQRILASFSNQFTIIIEDLDGDLVPNHLFQAAEIYLQPTTAPGTSRFRVTLPKKETNISFVMERNSEMFDSFDGVNLKWRLITRRISPRYINRSDPYSNPTYVSEIRRHELTFHRKHREMVLTKYLPYVLDISAEMKQEKKALKLFTLRMDGRRVRGGGDPWQSVTLDHPANFDTVAMEVGAKEAIIEDLERFLKRKGMYRRVGKAWKRGYLLYGPPGTGKSSLVAAMANYLNFDIYDLELGAVRRNSDLRKVLIATANRSILVVEDIDCTAVVPDRRPRTNRSYVNQFGVVMEEKKVTLSGLLNFVDGLWSSCGDERIIVFTTNHKEKLDPALLRPGRMDVHIHMSYCTPGGFDVLANNYLGTVTHPMFPKVKDLIGLSRVTPAEVGEQLLKHSDPELAIIRLIEFLHEKKEEALQGLAD